MTAEGHLIFSVACAIFAKKAALTPALAHGDWWHIIPAALLTALLPDIDHPYSLLGRRLKFLSIPISRIFGHRGFTHSLLAIIGLAALFNFNAPDTWIIPTDVLHAMIVGYLSHLLADMLTPSGVPLLWPCRWRCRLPLLRSQRNKNYGEKALGLFLIGCALYWNSGINIPFMSYWDYLKNLLL